MAALKLSEIFTYKPLSKYEGLYGKLPCRTPTTYIGLELELENVAYKTERTVLPTSFTRIDDGSLKMNGKEFVTRPIRFCYLEQELTRLFSILKKPLMSSRCSIHVHMNARDFTLEELSKFIMLYCIFEKSLFQFANKKYNRWNNIFCTPLFMYPQQVVQQLAYLIQNVPEFHWFKYYAMNLCPIFGGESKHQLGTIEFRHMEATDDVEHIINWVNLIVSLKIAAKKFHTDELVHLVQKMNTDSSYHTLAQTVFEQWSPLITNQNTFKVDVESCIAMTKHILIGSGYIQKSEKIMIEIPKPTPKGTSVCVVSSES